MVAWEGGVEAGSRDCAGLSCSRGPPSDGGHKLHKSSWLAIRRQISFKQECRYWTVCQVVVGVSPTLGGLGEKQGSGMRERIMRMVVGGPCQTSGSVMLRQGPFSANAQVASEPWAGEGEGAQLVREKSGPWGFYL